MHGFAYQNGVLHCEDVNLEQLAADHGTPLYVYSANTIRGHVQRLRDALAPLDHKIAFAVKANSNLAVLNLLANFGTGFDIVSGGELFRVLKAGGNASDCSFAGVGKTRDEIRYALEQGIHCFNAESEAEVVAINEVAGSLGMSAPVALRVNPNVDAKTHKYISTGKQENKFGIDFDHIEAAYERAAALPHIRLRGLQMHIGSQLTSVQPFVEAVAKVAPLAERLRDRFGIEFFSIGGGIGIIYHDTLASGAEDWWRAGDHDQPPLTLDTYAAEVVPLLQPLGLKIILEPGRLITGNAGVLLTRVLYHKAGSARNFMIIDAGMNDLIRPALYEGHHDIVPVSQDDAAGTTPDDPREVFDVVGPICETGDFLAQDRPLPRVPEGGLLAVLSAGAYGFVMASNYNSRPLPAEVLVDAGVARLVRRRQTLDDLIAGESIL